MMSDEVIVYVRRHPMDYRTARYRLSDIMRLHISEISGGLNRPLAYPGVFGYAFCNTMVDGEIAHSCSHGPPPHEILVYLMKGLNKPVWKAVQARLEEDRARYWKRGGPMR